MISRADVERAILDEETMLDLVAGLLEKRCDFATWPEDARVALALALDDQLTSRSEGWKVVTLRRHLFGPQGVVPEHLASPRAPSLVDRRRAESLRAGLPARVRYRIATSLR